MFVNVQYFAIGDRRAVVLPYRSGVPLEQLWPNGLASAKDVASNPGVEIMDARAFPGPTPSSYLTWQPSIQSNLYQIRKPKQRLPISRFDAAPNVFGIADADPARSIMRRSERADVGHSG
jgi:hypothetical protein